MSSKEANIRYYHLDVDSPIYPDLKAVFLKTMGIGDFLRQHVSSLDSIQVCFIYGSVANDTEVAGSDMDLMVIGDVDVAEFNTAIDHAEELLRREINCTILTPEEWQQKQQTSVYRQIRAQPKIFLIGSENVLQGIGT
jgi:hypothetical protein